MESYTSTCTNIYERLETRHSKLNKPGERCLFNIWNLYVRPVFDRMKFCFDQSAFDIVFLV